MSLASLIAEVEKLTAPSREVDLAIARAVAPDVIVMRQRDDDSGADPYTYWCYTASIDAVVALIERELPGADINLTDVNADFRSKDAPATDWRYLADVFHDLTWPVDPEYGYPDPKYGTTGSGKSNANRAIALLAAALRALEARAG